MADVFNIAGRIHSTSQEEVVTTTNEILDATQEKKQSEVNQEVNEELALHTNRLNALTGQNYVTVVATQSTTAADIPTLINASGEGEQTDTLYRVGFWDGSAYVADKYTEYAWNGTAYVILDVKSSIGEVFDISQYNAVGGTLTPYVDLEAALSGTNVPTTVHQGGMSVKFIQTSDNKYMQYRLTADEWSTNTEDWSFCGDDVLVDNPYFARVFLDKKNKIAVAITVDGGVYYGAGVPKQVVEYINEQIEELNLPQIIEFLDGIESGDKTLSELLDEKVDAEDGKTLINENVVDYFKNLDNPYWLNVGLTSGEKIVEGVTRDGKKELRIPVTFFDNVYFRRGIETSFTKIEHIEKNDFLKLFIDKNNKISSFRKNDGTLVEYAGLETPLAFIKELQVQKMSFKDGVPEELKNYVNETVGNDPESVIPSVIYGVVGHPFSIYYYNIFKKDNLDQYHFFLNGASSEVQNLGTRIRFACSTTGTYNITINMRKDNTDNILSKTLQVQILADNIPSIKAIFIGDSFIDGGKIQAELVNMMNSSLTLYGTRTFNTTDSAGNTRSGNDEGRAGWSLTDYCTKATYRDMTNAFWDGAKFDFSYYITQNPTFSDVTDVFILSGPNDVNSSNFIYYYQKIMESIKGYNNNIRIHVMMPLTCVCLGYAWGVRSNNGAEEFRYSMMQHGQNILKFMSNMENVFIIPTHVNFDKFYDFPITQVNVNDRTPIQVDVNNDNVHPSEYGYFCMADMVYGDIIKNCN